MVDVFSIALSHALIAIAVLKLIMRADLDDDSHTPPGKRVRRRRS
ncbi:MAG: hypothetical protein WA954_04205 [Parerythrobacter sp.]